MSEYQEYIDATLEWCNKQRKRKGMEPLTELPKGERRNGTSCPCGKATGMLVGAEIARDLTESKYFLPEIFDLPPKVMTFINKFDNGHIPELDEFNERFS